MSYIHTTNEDLGY